MNAIDEEFIRSSRNSGKAYGYPQCCIDAFCVNTPTQMSKRRVSKADKLRFKSGHINGTFTGFIPCLSHALKIHRGEITLESLISATPERTLPFPNDWGYQ